MSLINKMLQDLDARGGAAGAAHEPELKAVPQMEPGRRPLVLAGAVLAALLVAAAGWYGWHVWQARSVAQSGTQPATPIAPAAVTPPAPAPVPIAASPSAPPPESPVPASAIAPPEPAVASSPTRASAKPQAEPLASPLAEEAVDATTSAAPRARKPVTAAAATRVATATSTVTDLTPKQVAENTYRRALASLQEGRVTSALADLDKAVEIDPRNDAARQTYVSLLLENKRTDDAMRQLRLALGIDPGQPGLAMVLARLQLEKGGPALQTLLTTLPYAGNSAEYHGFLAGVLQREHRNDEAAQHYRDALSLSPNNGVWWMGLGISLQAGQHLPEAREAYTRARAAAGLTPELQAFIDRKLEQLSH